MGYMIKPASFICFIILGYTLKAIGFFGKTDHRITSRIMLNITLPCAVVLAFDGFEGNGQLYWVALISLLMSLLPVLLMYALTAKREIGERLFRMLNIGGYNTGCFSVPLLEVFLGTPGVLVGVFFDIGNSLMMTGGAYAMTTSLLKLGGQKKENLPETVLKFLKSVPFDTYLVMLLLTMLHIRLPEWLFSVIRPAAQANSFIAMLTIGMMIEPVTDRKLLTESGKLLLWRYGLALTYALIAWYILPMDLTIRRVLVVMCFAPLSSLSAVFTDRCGGNTALASVTNSISIVISLIAMLTLLISFMGA